MELKKTIRKVTALAAGASMLGATMMGAFAADLNEYPAPFIKDGVFDAVLVVGEKAASSDVLGVTDIQGSLQFAAKKKKAIAGATPSTTTTVEGDAWQVTTSAKSLEITEDLNDIQTTITDEELNALADGTFRPSGKSAVTYEQTLKFFDSLNVSDTEDDDDNIGVMLYTASSSNFANYTLTFNSDAESDISSSACEDFNNRQITILGKKYTITSSTCSSSAESITLNLMGGAVEDTLEEGQTKSYKLGGKDYEVTVLIVEDVTNPRAKLKVNTETTDELGTASGQADTYTLDDGTIIGVRSVISSEAGDVAGDQVTFYLGADKLVLQDDNISDLASSHKLKVAEDTMDYVDVLVRGTHTSTAKKLSEITLAYTADDNYFVRPGEKISKHMREPEGLLNWDVRYEGLSGDAGDPITFKSSGDKQYKLGFMSDAGQVNLDLFYADSGVTVWGGSSDKVLHLNASQAIKKNEHFALTSGSSVTTSSKTYVLKYNGATVTSDGTTLRFTDLATGTSLEPSFNSSTADGAVLRLGGNEFTVNSAVADTTANDFNITVAGEGTTFVPNKLKTKGNAVISFKDRLNATQDGLFTNSAAGSQAFNFTVALIADTSLYDTLAPRTFDFNVSASTTSQVGDIVQLGSAYNFRTMKENDDASEAYSTYGALARLTSETSSPDKLEIFWPNKQREALVWVTSGATSSTTSEGGAGDTFTEEIVKIDVGAAKLDKNVADYKSTNLIVVGGPCANTVALAVMGSPSPCGKDFAPGKAKIKLYDTGSGKVALLVAGYEAEDTTAAARVVAQYDVWKTKGSFKGMELEVSDTSKATPMVAAPSEPAPAAAPDAAPAATGATQ